MRDGQVVTTKPLVLCDRQALKLRLSQILSVRLFVREVNKIERFRLHSHLFKVQNEQEERSSLKRKIA